MANYKQLKNELADADRAIDDAYDEAKKMALEGRKIALEKFDAKLVNQKIINTMKLRSNENELVQQNS